MESTHYIKQAIEALDKKVKAIVLDATIDLKNKDKIMLPLSQEKRILKQALEDLEYLKANPPIQEAGCKAGMSRED